MIVPEYWAEARKQHRHAGKQVTVRRFGWSDESQAAAEAMAESRAVVALAQLTSGQDVPRREPKIPYNGAQGVPIREEVLARHGDVVITRNAYGARCLNTPDVLFADVDFRATPDVRYRRALIAAAIVVAAVLGWQLQSGLMAGVVAIAGVATAWPLASLFDRALINTKDSTEQEAMARVRAFMLDHPAWGLRVYRTPAGLRLLATHRLFSPSEVEVQDFFSKVGADPIFVRMCMNQKCFRARLTAKPWRMGMTTAIRPRPGVWPVRPERLKERAAWVAVYEQRAADFSACQFVDALGSGAIDSKVAEVVALHDAESRATVVGLGMA